MYSKAMNLGQVYFPYITVMVKGIPCLHILTMWYIAFKEFYHLPNLFFDSVVLKVVFGPEAEALPGKLL